MKTFNRLVFRLLATVVVMIGMAFAPVYAVSDNKIGDNVRTNTGVGLVLMVSIKRNR